MRRLLAITITLLLGFTLVAPLFAFDAAGSLSECCRRNGRHHCAAGMTDEAGNSRTVSAIAPKCPSFPRAIAAPHSTGMKFVAVLNSGIPVFAMQSSAPQTEARYHISYARSRQKRGPPINLL
jgi:hypothetical protein